jgi:hypothetical protein
VWPTRGKVKIFTQNPTFVELRFTKNDSFQHVCRKATEVTGKHHCALCYHRQSKFGCSTCKVLLCRTNLGNRDSCFHIWHSKRDLVAERKSVSTYHYKQNTENVRRTTISSAEGDVDEVPTASVTCRKRKEPDAITVERRQKKRPAVTPVKKKTLRPKMKGLKMKGMQQLSQNRKDQLNWQQQGQLNPQQRQESQGQINPQQMQRSHQDQWLKRYGHRGLQENQQPHQSARQPPCRQ